MASACSLCMEQPESSQHMFSDCKFVVSLWDWISYVFCTAINTSNIPNMFLACKRFWCPQVKELWAASIVHIVSIIWFCRNQARFKTLLNLSAAMAKLKLEISLSGNMSNALARPTILELTILKSLNVRINYSLASNIIEVCWLPPIRGWTKVNSDRAARGAHGSAGGGAIFKDHNGDFLAYFADYFGIQSALFAELNLALMAIEFASNMGWNTHWLECDSSLVVDIFKGAAKPPWNLVNQWNFCQGIMEIMQINVSHIFWEGNFCADRLANFGITSNCKTTWTEIPPFISHEFHRKRNLLPNYRFSSL
ncbi:PREDICTED: uncharacterized protein LOC109352874 [Lupinus angustifolius]|uniref:uncharacterized protein LOC109352874 n=1 Tax=Lupinus angustifolius TaxID=3871 RepID=UPI00092EC589|nr:PREDICTED: uncharacterized protein LOC109352874 [Lupinus angustifolius]